MNVSKKNLLNNNKAVNSKNLLNSQKTLNEINNELNVTKCNKNKYFNIKY